MNNKTFQTCMVMSSVCLFISNTIVIYLSGFYETAYALVVLGIVGWIAGWLTGRYLDRKERKYYEENILNPIIEFNQRIRAQGDEDEKEH